MSEAATHVLGIRHHGPGSARSLVRALEEIDPDVVLIEGPPDADDIIAFAGHADMSPPVALLVHAADDPRRGTFHPFASFSPEWIALRHALSRSIPVRFADLPQSVQLAEPRDEEIEPDRAHADPLGLLAEAAGHRDGERWWDHAVESRRTGGLEIFAAVAEAMTELRASLPAADDVVEARREAAMRRAIRKARKDGFKRITFVCGAWHVPALLDMPSAKQDDELLKGLPTVKVHAAWVPWTHARLAAASGYRAGVHSPEWYHLLFEQQDDVVATWMTRAGRTLREKDLDASSGHVIEAVRLAESLAAIRRRALPGLDELRDAALSVLCFGQPAPLAIIERALVVGTRLGSVPSDAPSTPLQRDLESLQKRLRLKPSADEKDLDLDLRQPMDLERSHLMHRLVLLGIPWGAPRAEKRRSTGTFHEDWRLCWKPELSIAIIDASRWGNTMESAATSFAIARAQEASSLGDLTTLVEHAMLASLADAADPIARALQSRAAHAPDAAEILVALPPLARTLRHGSVRETDTSLVSTVVDGMVARACIGLGGACASADDDAARALVDAIIGADEALRLLDRPEHREAWHQALRALAESDSIHGLLSGRACRILRDANVLDATAVTTRASLALSPGTPPAAAAAWLEGFLSGSGMLLLHDDALLALVDDWICSQGEDRFIETLPLVRRTFATFVPAERRNIAAKIGRGAIVEASASRAGFDSSRADAVMPLVLRILGLETTK